MCDLKMTKGCAFSEDMDKAKGEGAKSDKDFKNRLAALKRKAEATQVIANSVFERPC